MANQIHALIVDDSRLARMMMRKFIGKLRPDWEVREAKDGDEALDAIGHGVLDVAFVDYNMPGMTGTELVRRLKQIRPDIKIAMISANIQDHIVEEARGLGIAFISKPVDQNAIDAAITLFGC